MRLGIRVYCLNQKSEFSIVQIRVKSDLNNSNFWFWTKKSLIFLFKSDVIGPLSLILIGSFFRLEFFQNHNKDGCRCEEPACSIFCKKWGIFYVFLDVNSWMLLRIEYWKALLLVLSLLGSIVRLSMVFFLPFQSIG